MAQSITSFRAAEAGFSLLEFLLSMALSLVILVELVTAYLNNFKAYNLAEAIFQLQENARHASQWVSHDLRMAGYIGCRPLHPSYLFPNVLGQEFSLATRVWAFQQGKIPSYYPLLPGLAAIIHKALPGSDILLIQAAEPAAWAATGAADHVYCAAATHFKTQELVVIANCQHAALVRVINNENHSLQVVPNLVNNYASADTQLSPFASVVYYLAKTDRKNSLGQPINALYRRNLQAAPTLPAELVEGVDKMQLELGVKSPSEGGIHDKKVNALTAGDTITSVKIAWLFTSLKPVLSATQTYIFAGQTYTPSDHLLRQAWLSTVAIREPS